jgi:corrinoid protein of di/trimethylamine methyltransferase
MASLTHKERILKTMRGEMVDRIPFVPRLDLWWIANNLGGTLPERHKGRKPDDIARAEGWACYHMVPDFTNMIKSPDDILHRSIGLFNFIQSVYGWRFSKDIEIEVKSESGQQVVSYHTPKGTVRTVGGLTEEMQRAGASLGWTQEHIIKKPSDYAIAGYIFENIEVFEQYETAKQYMDEVGEDGVVAAGGASLAASPMHHIQKEFLDPTRFYYEYNDHPKEMRRLAESVAVYFEKVLAVMGESPAEVVLWGANYDDMLTYPPYFEKEILPWLRKVSDYLGARGKLVATHTDGENFGLMDLIGDSGVHVAESVTPWPMTKVKIEEYYRRWRDKLTIMGGIPESILSADTADDDEFEAFLTNLFKNVVPGDRLILGTADSTPPRAVFDRLVRISERVQTEGTLPQTAGGFSPVSDQQMQKAEAMVTPATAPDDRFSVIRDDIISGDDDSLPARIRQLLDEGVSAHDILHRGMIPAMEIVGTRFKNGDLFIPEVLLSARAMNGALVLLEPRLAADRREAGRRVLIGTVRGDMHDIGKNMVAIMLKGVGFEVIDVGINVDTREFIRRVREEKPDILGLSALLTTTMDQMRVIIEALKEEGLRNSVAVMVGGAPVNKKFADGIGADGWAKDAVEAVDVARLLLKKG